MDVPGVPDFFLLGPLQLSQAICILFPILFQPHHFFYSFAILLKFSALVSAFFFHGQIIIWILKIAEWNSEIADHNANCRGKVLVQLPCDLLRERCALLSAGGNSPSTNYSPRAGQREWKRQNIECFRRK